MTAPMSGPAFTCQCPTEVWALRRAIQEESLKRSILTSVFWLLLRFLLRRKIYGPNLIDVPVKSYLRLLVDEVHLCQVARLLPSCFSRRGKNRALLSLGEPGRTLSSAKCVPRKRDLVGNRRRDFESLLSPAAA